MEEIFKGIVISAKDYKEKDKLITIFSAEMGLISIVVRGVKNPNAKLKFAKELFSFGEFNTSSKGDYRILTSCNIIETFHDLPLNPEKYFEACSLINIIKVLMNYNEPNINLFLEFINSIKILAWAETKNNLVLSKFLISVFNISGYEFLLKNCASCGMAFCGKKYLLLDTGEIVCASCRVGESVLISDSVFSNLRIINNLGYEKLASLKLKNMDETLKILALNFKYRFGKELKLF